MTWCRYGCRLSKCEAQCTPVLHSFRSTPRRHCLICLAPGKRSCRAARLGTEGMLAQSNRQMVLRIQTPETNRHFVLEETEQCKRDRCRWKLGSIRRPKFLSLEACRVVYANNHLEFVTSSKNELPVGLQRAFHNKLSAAKRCNIVVGYELFEPRAQHAAYLLEIVGPACRTKLCNY
jgi:hypothetical protein